jgi:hypothetical protein
MSSYRRLANNESGSWPLTLITACPPPPDCPTDVYRNTPTTCAPLASLPPNAVPRTEGVWACAPGWFFRPTAGLPCAPTSCAGGERFNPATCGGVSSGCTPCRDDWGSGVTLRRDTPGGQCLYQCEPPMRPNTNSSSANDFPCTTCGDAPPFGSFCPPGQAWHNCSCAPCPAPPSPLFLLAPSADAVCRVWCHPGFLTLAIDTLRPVDDNALLPQDPSRIACQACTKQPRLLCAQCPVGTLAPHCAPCVAPVCTHPTYAPAAETCPGGAAGPMPCLLCPPLGDRRAWVAPPCVSACVRDTYAAYGDTCVPCATLPIPPGAPYEVYRALWNATPGVRWWPPVFDPPHMRPRTSTATTRQAAEEEEPRAGVCWPCAATTCGLAPNKQQQPTDEVLLIIRLPIQKRRLLVHSLLHNKRTTTAYTLDRRRISHITYTFRLQSQ